MKIVRPMPLGEAIFCAAGVAYCWGRDCSYILLSSLPAEEEVVPLQPFKTDSANKSSFPIHDCS